MESFVKNALYILGCGMIGGFIRCLKSCGRNDSMDKVTMTAKFMTSVLFALGAFAVCELFDMPFAFTTFMMVLFAFFDGRLLLAIDECLAMTVENAGVAVVRVLEHWGTKKR